MDQCVFCDRIEKGEYDDDRWDTVTFEPLNPVVPGHRLFVPREHVRTAASDPFVSAQAMAFACDYAGRQYTQFNLITSAGGAATQTVPHLHIHYVPRTAGDGLLLPWSNQKRLTND